VQLWPKAVLRKWLNISSKDTDFSADEAETTEIEFEYEGTCTIDFPFLSLFGVFFSCTLCVWYFS
jgi:hypothetical protein